MYVATGIPLILKMWISMPVIAVRVSIARKSQSLICENRNLMSFL